MTIDLENSNFIESDIFYLKNEIASFMKNQRCIFAVDKNKEIHYLSFGNLSFSEDCYTYKMCFVFPKYLFVKDDSFVRSILSYRIDYIDDVWFLDFEDFKNEILIAKSKGFDVLLTNDNKDSFVFTKNEYVSYINDDLHFDINETLYLDELFEKDFNKLNID